MNENTSHVRRRAWPCLEEVSMLRVGMRGRIRALLLGLLFSAVMAAGWVSAASATTAIRLTHEVHAQKSDIVVMATVTSQKTFRAVDGMVYTDTTVRIDQGLMGDVEAGQTLTIRQMGGVIDGVQRVVVGDAAFTDGEQTVLFLADREPNTGVVFLTAMAQSKFSIVGQDASGDLFLVHDLRGLTFFNPDSDHPLNGGTKADLTLGSLRNAIAAAGEKESK